FVAVLRVDRLARCHAEDLAGDPERDVLHRLQVHLDPRVGVVPAGDVAQLSDGDGAAQLPVDAAGEVEVELRGNATGIIISGDEGGGVLDEVHADQQLR